MDKPDFDNGVAGPPTKRLKISIETPSTITTTQPVKPAKMDDRKTRLVIVDSGFQPERESQVGILCFVNDANPGFSGTLKQRCVSGCYCLSPFILEACSIQSLLLDVVLLSYDVGAKMGWDGCCASHLGRCHHLRHSQPGIAYLNTILSIFHQTTLRHALADFNLDTLTLWSMKSCLMALWFTLPMTKHPRSRPRQR
jgi:hypothetical protein